MLAFKRVSNFTVPARAREYDRVRPELGVPTISRGGRWRFKPRFGFTTSTVSLAAPQCAGAVARPNPLIPAAPRHAKPKPNPATRFPQLLHELSHHLGTPLQTIEGSITTEGAYGVLTAIGRPPEPPQSSSPERRS